MKYRLPFVVFVCPRLNRAGNVGLGFAVPEFTLISRSLHQTVDSYTFLKDQCKSIRIPRKPFGNKRARLPRTFHSVTFTEDDL